MDWDGTQFSIQDLLPGKLTVSTPLSYPETKTSAQHLSPYPGTPVSGVLT
jgi:hypothetical protein